MSIKGRGRYKRTARAVQSSYTKGAVHHHIQKSRERIKGYSWLCVIFKNLGIDCYSNIFIAILNETLIRFFGLAKRNARGQWKNPVDRGNTVLQLWKCCLISIRVRTKTTNRLDLSSPFLPVKKDKWCSVVQNLGFGYNFIIVLPHEIPFTWIYQSCCIMTTWETLTNMMAYSYKMVCRWRDVLPLSWANA